MYNVNVKGPFLGIKYALPVMKKIGGGSIINMSSVCGLIGHMYTPEAYTTTKGAVSLLTRAVAARYGKFNIRCNSINPSTADTPLVREMLKDPSGRRRGSEKCRSVGWPACRISPRRRFISLRMRARHRRHRPTGRRRRHRLLTQDEPRGCRTCNNKNAVRHERIRKDRRADRGQPGIYNRKLIHAAGGSTSVRDRDVVRITQTGAELGKLTQERSSRSTLRAKSWKDRGRRRKWTCIWRCTGREAVPRRSSMCIRPMRLPIRR